MRQRLRIDLAYDGAPFSGFARQPDQQTVQGVLEGALHRLFRQDLKTVCAGRTDSGVHALAQVIHVDVQADAEHAQRALDDLDVLRFRLDRNVGSAITIWKVHRVGPTFDARFSARGRRYRYRVVDAPVIDPLARFNHWHIKTRLDVAAMRAAAAHLVGEHDFAALCRRSEGKSTVRRLDRVAISRPVPGTLHVRLAGAAFCHQQVRAILGCLVEVGRERRAPEWMGQVLASRDRSVAGPVAPPHGLTLEGVSYGRRWPAAPPK